MKYWIYKHSWSNTEKLFNNIKNDSRVAYYGCISWVPKFNSLWYLYSKRLKKNRQIPANLLKLPSNYNEQYCFVFLGGINVSIGIAIMSIMRKRFKDSIAVAYFTDIDDLKRFDVKELKRVFDKVFVFNEVVAKQCDIDYCPLPFSFIYRSDIVYVGQSKGRIGELQELNRFFVDNGISTFFYIANKKEKKPHKIKGVYIGPPMDYEKMLIYLLSSNCILELKSKTTFAYTDRVQKAIFFNKKILTNNKSVLDNIYSNAQMVSYFNHLSDIDLSFLKKSNCLFAYDYKGDFDPSHLLDLIDGSLIR